jgi:hypothetical protein
MKWEDIIAITQKYNIKVSSLNKATLIQSIQRAEGDVPCFAVGRASECGQLNCIWKEDCI